MKNEQNRVTFWATILIAFGGLFLLRNFDFLDFNFPRKLISWPLIPLIIGINAFFRGETAKSAIAIGIAVVFYIPMFLPAEYNADYRKMWPLLLIAAGLLIFYKSRNSSFRSGRVAESDIEKHNFINESQLMSGSSKKIVSQTFGGGRISCVMAGSQIDLTESQLSASPVIEVFVLMSGLELNIPKDWNVTIDVLPIMGGVDDQISKYPTMVVNNDKKLLIVGQVIMGGIEIKRY
jgi:Domain of unknown function (DUF5668)